MEKVISGLLTVNGCDPEKDTYVDITRLSCRLGIKMVNADINASVDCIVPFTGTGIKAQNDRIVNRYYHIVPFAGTGIKAIKG